jgi:hypothetical protein
MAAAVILGSPETGRVRITVTESPAAEPIPCRVHLKNAAGEPQRAGDLPFWRDHFVCPGTVELELPPGGYAYEIERGPEYRTGAGMFRVRAGAVERVTVTLQRLADRAAEGWWSGEMHVHRPIDEMQLLMSAEDLHVALAITWWNNRSLWAERPTPENPLMRFDGNRFCHVLAGEDEREGGALLYFHLPRPLAIAGSSREFPSPIEFVSEARRHPGAWIDVEKPFWWDVPVWLASGQVDSIGIANNHMCRSQMYETEAWGKPRDVDRLPPPLGNGFWTQEIYYHILNCGLRIPPSAGSASGVLPNPVGYNRVYAYLGDRFDYDAWWQAVRDGRTFVTNGPLLRVSASSQLPGHVFTAPAGTTHELNISLDLVSRDRIDRVEIIQDGQIVRTVRCDDWSQVDSLGSVQFGESGWFLVRAIADNPRTFRFASTAPYYVEIGPAKHRISRTSAQFFLDWVDERMRRVKLDDAAQREQVLEHHRRARKFWQDRAAQANAP